MTPARPNEHDAVASPSTPAPVAESQSTKAKGRGSRREFIRESSLLMAGGTLAAQLSISRSAHAFGSDLIKIGMIGCGSRGTGAASEALNTKGSTRLVALADVFPDSIAKCLRGLSRHSEQLDVPPERQFAGFDGFKGVLQSDCDLVILSTPPGYRPMHFEAAVQANKHVFMEKPVAVDVPGAKRILAATEEARRRNLAVAVGLQRHHEPRYVETVKRLQDGAIGDILLARAYWNSGGVFVRPRQAEQTELEYQLRNWYYFNWLCGDHIVEQHIHNLDVINWIKNAYPVEANGQGGRQVRTGLDYGQIFDHHFVEYTYADGTKLFSQCRHIVNTWNSVSEHVHGINGSCNVSNFTIKDRQGNTTWKYGGGGGEGHQQEHHDLFASLRNGEIPNEGEYGAMSTMTAILGRMATYSGQAVTMEEALKSEHQWADLTKLTSVQDPAPILPGKDGRYEVATPGITPPV